MHLGRFVLVNFHEFDFTATNRSQDTSVRTRHTLHAQTRWLKVAPLPRQNVFITLVSKVEFNPLKGSGVRWFHFEVFSAIQV